jgi:hypothetical protein
MRKVSSRIGRSAAVLVLLAITSQAAAAPIVKERLTVREYVKRLVIKAFEQLGCPPG